MISFLFTDKRILLYIILYLIFGLLEMRFAVEKGHTLSNKLINFFYGILLFITGVVVVGFMYSLIPFQPRTLPDRGVGYSVLMALFYLFISDLAFYWYHRAQHRFRFLWALHELHHTDTELNATTSMRTYWLDRPFQALAISIPVSYLLGIDALGINIYLVIFTVWLFFTHANLKVRFGIFTRIFCGPQLHRIHHSNLPEHQGKNIAQFFPIFDILFGTYYHPGYNEFPATGLPGEPAKHSIVDAMLKPFTIWFNLKRNQKTST